MCLITIYLKSYHLNIHPNKTPIGHLMLSMYTIYV